MDFKDDVIKAVINTVPSGDVDETLLLSGTGKINFTSSTDFNSKFKKCTLTITWDEQIEHPCKGCPGYGKYVKE